VLRRYGEPGGGRVQPQLARVLRAYQRVGYVPGPLLGAGLVGGLLAALGLWRARRSGLRAAAFLFSAMALVVLVPTVAVNQFSWRYQLPQLVLLAPALVLALTAWGVRNREAGRSGHTNAPVR
jgi:hypothetical protein